MLQIFVDDIDQLKNFIKFVIEEFGETRPKELEKLTNINLYHRLLECYLYKNQMNENRKAAHSLFTTATQEDIQKEIKTFIERYDQKIDKHYVLFLFQIYKYSEGVQGCCERLELKQELLNYYIQKGDKDKVLEVCE